MKPVSTAPAATMDEQDPRHQCLRSCWGSSVRRQEEVTNQRDSPRRGKGNVAIAASKQGGNVSYLTPLSKDTLGVLLSSRLKENGVKILSKSISNPTSLAVVSINEGIPSYSFHRNETAERKVNLENLLDIIPINTKIFHVGSLGLIEGKDAEIWEIFFKWKSCK